MIVYIMFQIPFLMPLLDDFHRDHSSFNKVHVGASSMISNSTIRLHGHNYSNSISLNSSFLSNTISRVNSDSEYMRFKTNAKSRYSRQLQRQNGLDVELYENVVLQMCLDLQKYGLWTDAVVRTYWIKFAPKLSIVNCSCS